LLIFYLIPDIRLTDNKYLRRDSKLIHEYLDKMRAYFLIAIRCRC